jgi:hypothetical protein
MAFGRVNRWNLFNKEKHFALSVLGIATLLVGGSFSIFALGLTGFAWQIGVAIGLPVVVLSILGLIFDGISKNEFV